MTRLTITGLFIIILAFSSLGQDNQDKHPIDIKNEKCHSIDSNQTTIGMLQCEATARDEWDKEMNKYYKLLMDILTIERQEKLIIAQRQWLDYRDKEFEFSSITYDEMEGTMWRIAAVRREREIIKLRALDLKNYYDTETLYRP